MQASSDPKLDHWDEPIHSIHTFKFQNYFSNKSNMRVPTGPVLLMAALGSLALAAPILKVRQ